MVTESDLCLCGDPKTSHGPSGCAVVGCFCEGVRERVRCSGRSEAVWPGHVVQCTYVEPHPYHPHQSSGMTWSD
jgi:hypothetical protein